MVCTPLCGHLLESENKNQYFSCENLWVQNYFVEISINADEGVIRRMLKFSLLLRMSDNSKDKDKRNSLIFCCLWQIFL